MEKSFFDTTSPLTDGVRIQLARTMRGKSQEELGKLINKSKQMVSKLEQKDKIDDEKMTEIATALGFTLDGLRALSRESIVNVHYNFYDNSAQNATFGNNCSQNINHNYGFDPKQVAEHAEIYELILKHNAEKVGK